MTLRNLPSFPSRRRYVIKFHDDAQAHPGGLAGKLENVVSGRQFDFRSDQELIALLVRDLRCSADAEPAAGSDS